LKGKTNDMNDHSTSLVTRLERATRERFGEEITPDSDLLGLEELVRIAEHRSQRRYTGRQIHPRLLRLLFACALSAPSKSDLQQADIIHVADRTKVSAITALIPEMPWIADAPVFLVFCGNNRRIRQIGEWRGKPFVNDHLDHFMNAAVDAAIIMTTFIRAAEAVGLGCCPISAVRNHCTQVSQLLNLPDCIFPVAGLCVGYPAQPGRISARLPLEVTVHTNCFDETGIREKVDAYDKRRHELLPYRRQRNTEHYGQSAFYGWSEDKARQYGVPERKDFGAFIRKKGFSLR